ncbi:TetR/AcrR family transcriptional regulator [Frankia sp. Mgl5]|uniref:TetR/AcrR family transcriptional regulator n=1 Tax=Frankia sp. Mgl5 TaxID=2933793 RepID=UPI0020101042|nr:TetR/AcrR family transcriptional regulator [Frankia sp. Mgl5]MCK9930708.1 TetR/AcrR family transcriptional regulator [Frankia sp. Mgl5]
MPDVLTISPSTKEQIVRAAEQLFAERGIEGVSLRQIGAAAGNGNNSAVQYHFGSKDQLIRAIFEYRLPSLHERRRILIARLHPNDLRSWVECYVLPILEQGEQKESNYLSFVAMLQPYGRRQFFATLAEEFQQATQAFHEQVRSLLPHIPEPLRTHRIAQALAFSVHAAADRERAQAGGRRVLPFAVHVSDLLDGLVGFLEAPVSPHALAALEGADPDDLPLIP